MGEHIVVQGGTFRNDAVYRTLELLSGKQISATDYPELMGAFGAALYAQNQLQISQLQITNCKLQDVGQFSAPEYTMRELNCKGCTNRCAIMRFNFNNGNVCYAGNKCEKVFSSSAKAEKKGFNAFERKLKTLF